MVGSPGNSSQHLRMNSPEPHYVKRWGCFWSPTKHKTLSNRFSLFLSALRFEMADYSWLLGVEKRVDVIFHYHEGTAVRGPHTHTHTLAMLGAWSFFPNSYKVLKVKFTKLADPWGKGSCSAHLVSLCLSPWLENSLSHLSMGSFRNTHIYKDTHTSTVPTCLQKAAGSQLSRPPGGQSCQVWLPCAFVLLPLFLIYTMCLYFMIYKMT
jgi:hypothetical protein